MQCRPFAALFALLTLGSPYALAADYSLSGYGTIGYAKSNQSFAYQRFIDDGGTLKRDSLVGMQLDVRFDSQFSATVQVKAQPSLSSDKGYDATVAWAFVSYRPANDWLFRAGKLRIPVYLYSENTDVGATFDFARLPTEVYSISPTTDFTGVSFRKDWFLDLGDVTLDGYWGKANIDVRFFARDGVLPQAPPRGAFFDPVKVTGKGFRLTLQRGDDTYRFAINQANARRASGSISRTFPFVELIPGTGIGRYVFADPDVVPVPSVDSTTNTAITIGADVGLGGGVRVVSEIARSVARDSDIAPSTRAAYVSVLKRLSGSPWTVYGTYAYLRSSPGPLSFYEKVNSNRVPVIPGVLDERTAGGINASQRVGADAIRAYDQSSWALGTSYSLTPRSKIKGEFQRVHVGRVSSLVDAPAGGDVRNTNINVYSLSYSFAF